MGEECGQVLVQLRSASGEELGGPLEVPLNVGIRELQLLCTALLPPPPPGPLAFFVLGCEVTGELDAALGTGAAERVVDVVYQPQAAFRVRAVTRCTSSLAGHAEPVLSVMFSPDGRQLASGSGDTTVRLWDLNTETPRLCCRGHRHWVLCLCWAPNGKKLASGCKNGEVRVWEPKSGSLLSTLTGHNKWVTSLDWEPLHLQGDCRRLVSGGKDSSLRVWDVQTGRCEHLLTGHSAAVTAVRWAGCGLIFSASQDRLIFAWRPDDGVLVRQMRCHGHWVTCLALSTDGAIRVHFDLDAGTGEEGQQKALNRYQELKAVLPERLASGSDDFTAALWYTEKGEDKGNSPQRLTGHQAAICHLAFSPDSARLATASFDHSIRLWNSKDGRYLATLRGHVGPVYRIAWSPDSRLLLSGSGDSTLKVWVATETVPTAAGTKATERRLKEDLPGHADEVFDVDWSADGERVASGGRDKLLRVWRN